MQEPGDCTSLVETLHSLHVCNLPGPPRIWCQRVRSQWMPAVTALFQLALCLHSSGTVTNTIALIYEQGNKKPEISKGYL